VLVNEDENDKLAACDTCRYTFCRRCRATYHSQTPCRDEYLIEKLQKRQQDLVHSEPNKNHELLRNLTEEYNLLTDVLSAEGIKGLNAQQCPNCRISIEKNGGCSHMYCTQCNHHFIWQKINRSKGPSVLADHTKKVEALVEEVYESIQLGLSIF